MNIHIEGGHVYILECIKLCCFGFCWHPNHLQICLNTKKSPPLFQSVLFLKQLVLKILFMTVLSIMLLLLPVSCSCTPCSFSHTASYGVLLQTRLGTQFCFGLVLSSCSLPVGRSIGGGEGWERLNTIKLQVFFTTVQAHLKSSISYNTGCKPDSLGS